MQPLSRRDLVKTSLGAMMTCSLLETLFAHDLFAGSVKPIAARWLADLNQLCADVKTPALGQIEWQLKVEELYSRVNLPELLKYLDFDRMAAGLELPGNGARSLQPKFPEVEGLPQKLVFGKQIFAMKQGRSVVPHGHNNMATAFLILKGDFRGRHYDRLEDSGDHYIIRPTIDRKFGTGEFSSISDHKDNIHWFKAESETGFIFNIHVLGVDQSNKEPTGRLYVDPNGEKLKGDLIRARKLDHKQAHELYG